MRIDPGIAAKYTRTELSGGELLVTLVGTVGEVAIAPRELAGWNVARAVAVVRPKGVTAEWLRYCFATPMVRSQISSALNTTVQATLNLTDLKKLVVPLSDPTQQRQVSEVLGALDDKIAANRRILAVADDLIRFEYDRLELSSGLTISSIAEEQKVKVEPSEIVPDGIYIGLEHIDKRFLWPTRTGRGSDVTSTKSAFVRGDTLFGKLRPYFHKVVAAPGEGVCSTDIIVIRPKCPELSTLVAAACSSDSVVAAAVQNSNGTRMPRAKWIDIADCSVPDPDSHAVERFVSLSSAVAERCFAAVAEIEVLARTRDELLPLLMDGRITVSQAADAVAAAL